MENLLKENKELRKQLNLLKIRNESLENFTNYAAHELRAPVRLTGLYLELVKRSAGLLDKNGLEYLDIAIIHSKRMSLLISELSIISKLEKNKKDYEEVDLNEVLKISLGHLSQIIKDKNVIIDAEVLPTIHCNKLQLVLLFQNLINNGIKFNKNSPPIIKISATKSGSQTILTFKDNGIGISEKNHKRIFDTYTKLHNVEKYEGSGIGLAICKKIVGFMNGTIEVESKKGEGSSFLVTI